MVTCFLPDASNIPPLEIKLYCCSEIETLYKYLSITKILIMACAILLSPFERSEPQHQANNQFDDFPRKNCVMFCLTSSFESMYSSLPCPIICLSIPKTRFSLPDPVNHFSKQGIKSGV